MSTTEIIGYLASFLILVSFLMKDMKKLRIINLFGCGAFIIYGVLNHAMPIVITNSAIVLINLYYLLKKEK
jgi:hypothetical protein